MEKIQSIKRYIYVSSKKREKLEKMCKEQGIYEQISFINTFECNYLFQSGLKNLNGVNYLFLDLSAIVNPSKNSQYIVSNLVLIRKMYPQIRIVIIAEGYKVGDPLLGKIFNLGIYNIITACDCHEYVKELKQTLSNEGMTFGNSMKYKVDSNILTIGSGSTKIEKEFIKARQNVSIGIVSTERHLGATTLGINICKYINEYPNEQACYIENNHHDTIINFQNLSRAVYFENMKKIKVDDVDLYRKPESIANIQNLDYSFYIYDYGAFTELSIEEKNSFLLKDIKFVVTGSRIWEYPYIVETIYFVQNDENVNLYINHTNIEEREEVKKSFDNFWKSKIYFSPVNPNPFQLLNENRDYYKSILTPYLINTVIEEKKSRFNGWFKKKRKE